jgi:hypothetical protein
LCGTEFDVVGVVGDHGHGGRSGLTKSKMANQASFGQQNIPQKFIFRRFPRISRCLLFI